MLSDAGEQAWDDLAESSIRSHAQTRGFQPPKAVVLGIEESFGATEATLMEEDLMLNEDDMSQNTSIPLVHPRDKAPTLHDVAARAGVTKSTVSKAFRRPELVSTETRLAILSIAAELDYVPIRRPTLVIGLFVPDVTNPFFSDVIRGCQAHLNVAGYTAMVMETGIAAESERKSLERLRKSTDGSILIATCMSDLDLTYEAAQHPLVAIDRPGVDVASVLIDTPNATAQALHHLVSLGHAKVAYVAGPSGSSSDERRWETLRLSAVDFGISLTRVGPHDPTLASGGIAAEASLRTGSTAFIVFNDLMAMGMLQRLRSLGVRVPQDVSIVGCDNIFTADFVSPPLTTISSPAEHAGRAAAALLVQKIRHVFGSTPRKHTVLPAFLTLRSSTGQAPGT
ncbi:LacI family transcriptional regulator [Paenarthrobacter nicotinovorans]|uniref:LacI family transcriptional regulator n=1 Tax=Paenarthrobacter nicotinovorans TaxID=29320 RepID=A0ABT9TMV6_PAENI|nr:LacI family DNA-binding transcriptional regulator [Paenarthrobacter nicotinovorans]MDQ0102999.1 LacI family transcriptional regulator [Paenarthrobacter nicotinovorans]